MDRFLSSITEIGLRRLYKFILKRIIGDYLESELLIEQLEVSSRTGLVTLTDLRLNCDIINEEHLGSASPFKLVSFTIAKLEVVISYVAVLHDGCRFRASGVEIILEPCSSPSSAVSTERKKDPTTTPENKVVSPTISNPTISGKKEHSQSSNNTSGPVLQSEEGQQGLDFIANWIEVVLARLEVSVEDVRMVIRGETLKPQPQPQPQPQRRQSRSRSNSTSSGMSGQTTNIPSPPPPPPTLIFILSRATFYNSNPRLPSNRSSTVASSVRMTQSTVGMGASTALSNYGSSKKVNIALC